VTRPRSTGGADPPIAVGVWRCLRAAPGRLQLCASVCYLDLITFTILA
jgi:hypothetical protein